MLLPVTCRDRLHRRLRVRQHQEIGPMLHRSCQRGAQSCQYTVHERAAASLHIKIKIHVVNGIVHYSSASELMLLIT